jgi:hypothetical protein
MSSGKPTDARIDLPASKAIIWGNATPVDVSRRQSTTPQNALSRLPSQRPVQLFTLDPSNYVGPNAIRLPREKTRIFDKEPPTHLQKYINFCAEAGRRGCAAFEDETFRRICGICTDPTAAGEVAGLYISEADRANQTDPQTGKTYEDIRPTFGTCPYKSFTVTAEQCVARKEVEKCLKEKSHDPRVINQLAPERHVNKNCAVNMETGEINLFPRRDPTGSAELLLGGRGMVAVTTAQGARVAEGNLADGIRVRLVSPEEGLILNLTVDGTTTAGQSTAIAGVLIGPTTRGPYVIDISKIIAVDEMTGLIPRRQGFINIEGDMNNRVFRIVPGVGRTTMKLILRLPLTFLAGPAAASTPIIRTPESIRQLGMEVCRNPASRPGNYSVDCLRYLWTINGCTAAGRGYPRDLKTAPALLWDDDARPRTFEQIDEYLRHIASLAHSGVGADGRRGGSAETAAAINFCLGESTSRPAKPPTAVQQTVTIPPPPLPQPSGLKARVQGRPSTIRDWLGAAAQAFNRFMGDEGSAAGKGLPGLQ